MEHSGLMIQQENLFLHFTIMNNLPDWVVNFNNSGKVDSYLKNDWNLLKSIETYQDLPSDNSVYEADLFNEGKTSFPHSFENVPKDQLYVKLAHTPFGNQIIIDLAKEAIVNEKLGQGELYRSFSN